MNHRRDLAGDNAMHLDLCVARPRGSPTALSAGPLPHSHARVIPRHPPVVIGGSRPQR